jgi:hypothetical protein
MKRLGRIGIVIALWSAAQGAGADPAVSDVRISQRRDSGLVDVFYDLANEAAIVTLSMETNGVALPDESVVSLSGDAAVIVQPGRDRHIVWNGRGFAGRAFESVRPDQGLAVCSPPPIW